MRLIFSRDRAAQLDLLFQSLKANGTPEKTKVIWWPSSVFYTEGYDVFADLWADEAIPFLSSAEYFGSILRHLLNDTSDETVTFFCDDDVLYRRPEADPRRMLLDERVLTVSLRLGRGNRQMLIPERFPVWDWTTLKPHDFGFPCSIDGHVFRVEDVLAMMGSDRIENPTALETVMAHRASLFAESRPLMACFEQQCLVGVPVNRVSETSGVPFGEKYPATTEELNRRFLGGERIDLDQLDFSGVDACHYEIPFVWKER